MAPAGQVPGAPAATAAPGRTTPSTTREPESWIVDTVPPRLAPRRSSHVEVAEFSCSPLAGTDEQSLGVTYWFDAKPTGEPYPMTVYFTGRIVGDVPAAAGRTTFETTASVENVLPGSGRVAVTARVAGLVPGTYEVTAVPVQRAPEGSAARWAEVRAPRLVRGTASGHTGLAPYIRNVAPGVVLGAWPTAVGAGFLIALALQYWLAGRLGLPAPTVSLLTLLASTLGLIGAKVYYLLTHRGEPRGLITTGMSVQGFVTTTVVTLVAGSLLLGLPIGAVLDATAPGLLLAAGVGRVGCLFAGCCVGKPTTSRWGIWSSDRRIGVRRIPVQVLESSLSLVIGALALVAVVWLGLGGHGWVLGVALAANVLVRQVLFPLRSTPRATTHGRSVTSVGATLVLVTSVVALLVR